MKSMFFICKSLLIISLISCSGGTYRPTNKILSDNHMDFPLVEKEHYKQIAFELSPLFTTAINSNFTIQSNAFKKVIYDINLNFSVEVFSESEAEKLKDKFSIPTDALNSVHDYYVSKRKNSLYLPAVSIKKNLSKMKGKEGVIQVIEGSTYTNRTVNSYFTSTLKVSNQYYVLQLIGKKDCMGYLYDDFENIIASVSKKK